VEKVKSKKIDLTPLRHTCKYCGQEKKLIDAHIIPEAFFRPLLNEKDPPRLMTDIAGIFPKRIRKGLYDKTILCRECEDNFAPWDDYGQLILLRRLKDAKAIRRGGEIVGLVFPNYDYAKLKLFFISVLWRASVSKHRFYEKIQLGPFESHAKELIERKDPGLPDNFSVTLAHFEEKIGMVPFDPYREKYFGVNFCRFYLGGYVALIKTDKRPSPSPIGDLALGKSDELYIISRRFIQSLELNIAKHIFKKAKH
jgi:hypothetical protein